MESSCVWRYANAREGKFQFQLRQDKIVCRSLTLQRFLVDKVAPATEEILASLLGSLHVTDDFDKQALVLKALDEALNCGVSAQEAVELIMELRGLLEDEL
jgi:hypothetical protein